MKISIQWIDNPTGVLRVHQDGDDFGSGYTWCCTIERRGEIAVLHGAMTAPPVYYVEDIEDELRKQGFKKAQWVRQSGKKVEVIL